MITKRNRTSSFSVVNSSVVLATRNEDKIKEIRQLLSGVERNLMTLHEFPGAPEVVEDGSTLEENAVKKATEIAIYTGLTAIADDTGLEVDFLNGAPGVFSGRFSGEHATYGDNIEKLLRELQGVSLEERSARFRCVVAVVDGDHTKTMEGACEGTILEEPRGDFGFGYDPVFYVPEYKCTFAEMDLALKNRVSHRARAFAALRELFETAEMG
ncbi:XTP/dITP diphosphatase [bacterium]|nr:XTP/dITP diphosphatase [bacterium]